MTMSFPVLAGEILAQAGYAFPFRAWASANRFTYPPTAAGFLGRTGSAAEAFFLRPFTLREGVTYPALGRAVVGSLEVRVQVPCTTYRIDAVVLEGNFRLAIEIDGMAFHQSTQEQVAADYLRERRMVLKGYTVIRFTAQEVFRDADDCWRQVEAILAARRAV